MKKDLEQLRKRQGGFTLVELVIVLVVLAILAALLVPSLLGYLDRAKSSKYLEEARSIYIAIQAVNDENYSKTNDPVALTNDDDLSNINKLVSPTQVSSGTITYLYTAAITASTSKDDVHKAYTVSSIDDLTFKSQDGNTIVIDMKADGSWDTDGMTVTAPASTTP